MAKFLNFFPRQVYMGDGAGSSTVFSPIFDVSDVESITWETRVYAESVTTLTGKVTLQDSDDPSETFNAMAAGTLNITGGPALYTGSVGTPKRFLRAKLEVTQGGFIQLNFVGRGFC